MPRLTPLDHHDPTWAARANDIAALQEMADSGIDLGKSFDGSTPLIEAASNGGIAAVELLIELGVDLNVVTSYSALHVAASNDDLEVLDLLLGAGANCSVVDTYGNTPLATLVSKKWATPERVRRMIELGANPHMQNRHGASPIDLAQKFEATELVASMQSAPLPEEADALVYREREHSSVLTSADGSEGWKALSAKLWDELVPPSGPAPTVQGELLRCIGSLTDEAYRNGNMNWGSTLSNWWTLSRTCCSTALSVTIERPS